MRLKVIPIIIFALVAIACSSTKNNKIAKIDIVDICHNKVKTTLHDPNSVTWSGDEQFNNSQSTENGYLIKGTFRSRGLVGHYIDFYTCVAYPNNNNWVAEITTGQMLDDDIDE